MNTITNTRTKLIWEPGHPWILHVDNTPIGAWINCRSWERGIEGEVNGEVYRIEVTK